LRIRNESDFQTRRTPRIRIPEVTEKMVEAGADPVANSPEQFAAFIHGGAQEMVEGGASFWRTRRMIGNPCSL
jgi:hypothetical protein